MTSDNDTAQDGVDHREECVVAIKQLPTPDAEIVGGPVTCSGRAVGEFWIVGTEGTVALCEAHRDEASRAGILEGESSERVNSSGGLD